MKLAIVQTLAAIVNPWLAFMDPSIKSQPQSYKPVGEIFSFQEKNKEYFIGTKSIAEVSVHFSKRTGRTYILKWDTLYESTSMAKEEKLVVGPRGQKIINPAAIKRECETILGGGSVIFTACRIRIQKKFITELTIARFVPPRTSWGLGNRP